MVVFFGGVIDVRTYVIVTVVVVFFLPPTGADTGLTLGQLAPCGGVFFGGWW